MNKCIETMMEEHRLIVQVLAALNSASRKLQAGVAVPREDIADFGAFFRQFADKCHHGKEEDRLFTKMNQFGFPRDFGPVGVMLAEHDAGRAQVRGLVEVGSGSGPLTPEESQRAIECSSEFVPLLFAHIEKENNILYPMAQQAIPADQFAQLDRDCESFDAEIVGPAEKARLKELAAELLRKYPSDPEELAAQFSSCGGCVSGRCG